MILTGNKPKKARSGIACTLIRFSLPLIFSGILQQLYNWADAFIVGNVEGELALAAIGATGTVVNFYLMAITGFTIGLAILFAQKFGSGENAAIPKILAAFSILLGLSFVLLAAVGIGLTSPLLRLMHTPQDTIKPAESYLKIIFTGVPFLAVYNVYSAALRGIGDSRAPFLAILFSSILNVALDLLFVAWLHWGVEGAAAATLSIARTIARKPSALLPRDTAAPVAASAPSTVMPDRAFMPDISGVCRRLGTFLINRYPTTVATIKISTKMIGCI